MNLEPTILQTYPTNLDYHNVSLVSRQISSIKSRSDIDTSVDFCGVKLEVPIVASPMKDVCDGKTAKKIRDLGGFAFLHRFCTIEEQLEEFFDSRSTAGCAIGLDDWERLTYLYHNGCEIFCLDVANGANENVGKTILTIYKEYPGVKLVTGNVCSKEGFDYLIKRRSNYVRVGVAGGHGCTTKNATGIYHPMISLIQECREHEVYYGGFDTTKRIIADGGIKGPDDFCKALIFGANVCMLGSQIAACSDSPAEYAQDKYLERSMAAFGMPRRKIYRGSASFENQKLYKDIPSYIEGATKYLDCKETIEELFIRYREGLQSSMSYFNAKNLKDYQNNLDYVCL